MPRDGVRQRLKQGGGFTDPVRQGRAFQIDPLSVEDLALPIKRQMIRIYVDQHMRQKAGTGSAALDRSRRQRRLSDPLATGAGHARTHDPVHHEAAGDVFELLGHVFAKPLQRAAARRAGPARRNHRLIARQVIRQGPALRLALVVCWRCCISLNRRFSRQGDLFLFQRQLKLIPRFRPRAELMAAQASKLMLQLLDEKVAGLQL